MAGVWKLTLRAAPGPGRLKLRLTGSGAGFCGLVLCGFLMSVNFSNNLIFAMTFLLVSIAMVGAYLTRSNLAGLAVGDWRVDPVFAGQKAVYRIHVENPSKRRRHGLFANARGMAPGDEIHPGPGAGTELILTRPAPKRGELPAAAADIRSCFPLGIFCARRITESLPPCIVYPAPAGDQNLSDRPSRARAHLKTESGTFTDTRRYAPGDPLSRIHWKALARFDELYTKEFDGARGEDPALWLRWEDVRAGGTEAKLSQLCRWILDAHARKQEYGLSLPGVTLPPSGGQAQFTACLTALALFEQGASGRPAGAGASGERGTP